MDNLVLKVESVSKQYRLGLIGTGTLSHDLNRWWYKIRGKEDPYLKLGEENIRSNKGKSEYVWALKDISFDIKQGEVLGIIGKNGAGKSTLLKILSRVTGPTTGSLKIKGRIASLLEVGTGFHPELTGRENIFLNGAILGMTKAEINRKLDEIIDFSGVERYIDTPVKRYSSGMYVRLAFAVAAHLEPEILVVDEVLAVGDAEFQKKCLGKMKDVSSKGRTVLFVSHNMSSVKSLCQKGILLENGKIVSNGNIDDVVNLYSKNDYSFNNIWKSDKDKNLPIYFKEIIATIKGYQPHLNLEIKCTLKITETFKKSFIAIDIADSDTNPIMQAIPIEKPFISGQSGETILAKTTIQLPPMIPGKYYLSCWIGSHYNETIDWQQHVVSFEIVDFPNPERTIPYTKNCGYLVPDSTIEINYL